MKALAAALFAAVVAILWLAIGATGRCSPFDSPLPSHSPIALPTRQYAPPDHAGQVNLAADEERMPAGDAAAAEAPDQVPISAHASQAAAAAQTQPTLSRYWNPSGAAAHVPATAGAPALGPGRQGGMAGIKPSPRTGR